MARDFSSDPITNHSELVVNHPSQLVVKHPTDLNPSQVYPGNYGSFKNQFPADLVATTRNPSDVYLVREGYGLQRENYGDVLSAFIRADSPNIAG
jgi:hypothetical protein